MNATLRKGGKAVRLALGLGLLTALPPCRLTAQAADRTTPPTLPPPAALHVPRAETARLANGLELVVVPMHKVPLVDVNLIVRAGTVRDPADLPGLATFTANLLDQGAGSRSAQQIAEQSAYLAAQLRTFATNEWAQIQIHVPRRQLDSALDLMADVALRPTFPDSEVTRQRELRRTGLLQLRDQPTAQAPIAFNAIVYGAAHPYGRPTGGTEASTALLTRERVQSFYNSYYHAGSAQLLFVGDVTLAEARRIAETRFGAWARGSEPALERPEAPAPSARTFYLVDKPGAAQSVLRLGNVGAARNSPDYYALRVMNTILGGSFTSRLNQNLRETHGFTYGANSSFALRRLAGPFAAAASVVTAKTDSSLIEFLKELRRIRDSIVPAEELTKAKAYLTLGFPGDFETTSGTAQQFFDLLVNDRPLTELGGFVAGINRVSAADVQRVARQYIDVDHLAIVVVGDRSQVESGIRALNEGPISLRDLWGQEIR